MPAKANLTRKLALALLSTTHGAPSWSTVHHFHERTIAIAAAAATDGTHDDHHHRPLSPPNDTAPPPPSAVGEDELTTATVDHTSSPSKSSSLPSEPTTVEPSSLQSKPLITMATTSTFQIRRGRKSTLITAATQGKSSSSVDNEFIFIPLRSKFDPIIGDHKHDANRFLLTPHLAVHFSQIHLPSKSWLARPGLNDPDRSSYGPHQAAPAPTWTQAPAASNGLHDASATASITPNSHCARSSRCHHPRRPAAVTAYVIMINTQDHPIHVFNIGSAVDDRCFCIEGSRNSYSARCYSDPSHFL
ncbi:hypothetical protein ACLOJK_034772 [Asimina triloba]